MTEAAAISVASLSTQLPSLSKLLQRVAILAKAGRLPNDAADTLQTLVAGASSRSTDLRTCLSQTTLLVNTSQGSQTTESLESLTIDIDTQAAADKIHQEIDYLALHQTTHNGNTNERVLEELAKLQLGFPSSSTPPRGHNFPAVSAHDQSNVHLGDVYHINYHDGSKVRSLGLCLTAAPVIDPGDFIGRALELDSMSHVLRPDEASNRASVEQRRLVLGGIGGIGKTQLAIAYARRYQRSYSSVIWLNATSEATLYASFRSIAKGLVAAVDLEKLDSDQVLARVLEWLSHPQNTQWLLIFDNHDEPDNFKIENFYPNIGHGSIIITTRLPELLIGQSVRVQSLSEIDDSLAILQARSRRENVRDDTGARHLAERLGGLPLALATAGAYLQKSTISFQQYLETYERNWQIDRRRPLRLHEYQDRTLYTTWNLTYSRLEDDDPEAAQMLKLLAYFDNQEVWYELFQAELSDHLPRWLRTSLIDQNNFNSVMRTLVEYCLVDVQHNNQTYSMHSCIHDWTLGKLNSVIDPQLYWYAFDCVAASLDEADWDSLKEMQYRRISFHGVRLTHDRFGNASELETGLLERLDRAAWIAQVLKEQSQFSAAESVCQRALLGMVKAFGPDHISTLAKVNLLGTFYYAQDRLDEAEQAYLRVLQAAEKTTEPDHATTLDAVNNLGILCWNQKRYAEAERLYLRALAGTERALGTLHTATLDTVNNLGLLYRDQGKLSEAKKMYIRALDGYSQVLAPDHIATLETVNNLAQLYHDQGKLDEAERMFQRVVAKRDKSLGREHVMTLTALRNLAAVFVDNGKLDEAERTYKRVLAGMEKVLGMYHISTLDTINDLGKLQYAQNKLDEAEQMYLRAVAGKMRSLGSDHTLTLDSQHCLANLYSKQDKLDQAESLFQRLLVGYETALGYDHPSTLLLVDNFGRLYEQQGRYEDAEQMYKRALAGYQKQLGREHSDTRYVKDNLDRFYRWKAQWKEKELSDAADEGLDIGKAIDDMESQNL